MDWNKHKDIVGQAIYDLVSLLPLLKKGKSSSPQGRNKKEILTESINLIDKSKFESEAAAEAVFWHFWIELRKAGIIQSYKARWYLTSSGKVAISRYQSSLLNVVVDENEAIIHNNLMERIGVSAIENYFSHLGWIFRERAHTDYGIDADVEMPERGCLSSRHIALQIKSGVSFFPSSGPAEYNMDWKHYSYWLLSDRPVVFMVFDPRDESIYWEQIRPGADLFTANKYTLKITHELTYDSKQDFERMVISFLPIIQISGTGVFSNDFAAFSLRSYLTSCSSLIEQFSSVLDSFNKNSPSENSLFVDLFRIELSAKYRIDALCLACFFSHINEVPKDWSDSVRRFNEGQKQWIIFLDNIKRRIVDYQNTRYASQSKTLAFTTDMCLEVLADYRTMIDRYMLLGKDFVENINDPQN